MCGLYLNSFLFAEIVTLIFPRLYDLGMFVAFRALDLTSSFQGFCCGGLLQGQSGGPQHASRICMPSIGLRPFAIDRRSSPVAVRMSVGRRSSLGRWSDVGCSSLDVGCGSSVGRLSSVVGRSWVIRPVAGRSSVAGRPPVCHRSVVSRSVARSSVDGRKLLLGVRRSVQRYDNNSVLTDQHPSAMTSPGGVGPAR